VRLDLFLKMSRLVKRRTIARELCEAGRVLVNGQESKPAKEVRRGDRVLLRYSAKNVEIEVLDLPMSSKKCDPGSLYRVTAETRIEHRDDT